VGNGFYTNCSNDELFLINALDMVYDEAVEVVVESGSVGNNGLSIDTSSFSNLLGSQSKNLFVIIGIVIGVIVVVTIIIIIICLCCNYCPKRVVVA
jgi:CBS domain containing-hemolysin-like protein